jgi:predicted RNase H-like nuclease (RuvC/YqgF family)
MNCEFCGKTFKTIYILRRHQTQTVCRKIRELTNTIDEMTNNKNQLINTLQNTIDDLKENHKAQVNAQVNAHHNAMQQIITLQQEINDLKEQNSELTLTSRIYEEKFNLVKDEYNELKVSCQQTHEKLLERATTKTNNTKYQTIINNLAPLQIDKDQLIDMLREDFDEAMMRAGQPGVARFVCNKVLIDPTGKALYKVLDINRLHGGFVTSDKKLVHDWNS